MSGPFTTCTIVETFLEYDGPVLFVASDEQGQAFLFTLLDISTDGTRAYLAATISPARWIALRYGEIPIRQVFAEPEGEVFLVGDSYTVTVNTALLTEKDLPEAGALINMSTTR